MTSCVPILPLFRNFQNLSYAGLVSVVIICWMITAIQRFEMALRMDLFSFIHHFDPTKVVIGERERAEGEPKLLTMTEGRVEHPLEGHDDVSLEAIAQDVLEFVIEKTKKPKRKRKITEDASGSIYPPKKLKEDYHIAPPNVGGKSLAAIRSLVPEGSSVLSDVAEPRVVTPTLNVRPTNSVSQLNLRTRPPGVRYVISLDDSHYLGSHSEAKSFVRSPVVDALVVTVAVTTTVTADTSAIRDSTSAGRANADTASVSKLNKASTSSDSFYASQSLDTKTMHRDYVPK
ncbi:hypothetical protein Tco_1546553 [Tanacetum coccineum]